MNKNIIIAGAIAIGIYLFSQGKSIFSAAASQTTRQRIAQKAAARKAAIRKAAGQKIGKKIGGTVGKKMLQKKIGQPITRAAHIAAARKAALRKAAAQKIGKKIGETVAQKIIRLKKTRRAIIDQKSKRQIQEILRPNPRKKQASSKLFPGSERSRIIPYSESSRHSYYGPKSHKLQNEGYRVEMNKRIYNGIEAYDNRVLMDVLQHPWLHRKK